MPILSLFELGPPKDFFQPSPDGSSSLNPMLVLLIAVIIISVAIIAVAFILTKPRKTSTPATLVICPQCRNRISVNANYCPECGEDIRPKTKP